ncbi:MAG: NAD(P)H-dependent oxidoreductase [Muribaculaceae bacterium]|nr:NAD(P)H-dependent oxidoreductase [Muribaculaceae bacterium]
MKVLMINGSPHPDGCTATALKEVADTLERQRGLFNKSCSVIHF